MGKYLRSLKSFAVHADTSIDEVLQSGQKVQFAGTPGPASVRRRPPVR